MPEPKVSTSTKSKKVKLSVLQPETLISNPPPRFSSFDPTKNIHLVERKRAQAKCDTITQSLWRASEKHPESREAVSEHEPSTEREVSTGHEASFEREGVEEHESLPKPEEIDDSIPPEVPSELAPVRKPQTQKNRTIQSKKTRKIGVYNPSQAALHSPLAASSIVDSAHLAASDEEIERARQQYSRIKSLIHEAKKEHKAKRDAVERMDRQMAEELEKERENARMEALKRQKKLKQQRRAKASEGLAALEQQTSNRQTQMKKLRRESKQLKEKFGKVPRFLKMEQDFDRREQNHVTNKHKEFLGRFKMAEGEEEFGRPSRSSSTQARYSKIGKNVWQSEQQIIYGMTKKGHLEAKKKEKERLKKYAELVHKRNQRKYSSPIRQVLGKAGLIDSKGPDAHWERSHIFEEELHLRELELERQLKQGKRSASYSSGTTQKSPYTSSSPSLIGKGVSAAGSAAPTTTISRLSGASRKTPTGIPGVSSMYRSASSAPADIDTLAGEASVLAIESSKAKLAALKDLGLFGASSEPKIDETEKEEEVVVKPEEKKTEIKKPSEEKKPVDEKEEEDFDEDFDDDFDE
ncbi:hypothetical protein ADUPG1_006810 [Aduncisulcus paluster]|uniref:Uncharacterized protein n=1 Tax=Aduncisulcus paluster TaxID=2918883 RepID=A0ABQ5KN62_9EUKA|nr:hypothetical protein ADUPG1_006810 [Aduncisulcus paluster]|eukprot:gnl/Carplike_NY0171/5472_a7481_212.p1 GENE.gnl/Carplike_NY0171/5472_a7481_212~~gnl/Carplike_NY0171/5472_a7481_212.p1  ORF type:complete len:580 (-),score=182.60 gnl/Carplike_NY0171/5472_a7481_212:63-1802(-)